MAAPSEPAQAREPTSWLARLLLAHEQEGIEAAVEEERRAFNVRRARFVMPVSVVSQSLMTVAFLRFLAVTSEAQRVWLFYTNVLNALTLAMMISTTAALFRGWRGARAVDLYAIWLLLWGGIASGNVQRTRATVDLFLFCNLGVALVFRLKPGALLGAQALSVAAVLHGIVTLQADPTIRRNEVFFVLGTAFLTFVVGRASFASLIRDLKNRRLIEEQQRQLEVLNTSLEDRVKAQVNEIVERSREIDQLNAELRQQVRERSRELSQALARIVQQHGEKGAIRPGDVLVERFEVEKLIGRGGMGAVYSARDKVTGERVAIKVIEASSARELDALHRFLREAHASARVEHPSVVYARHVDIDNNLLFMVFAFVKGESLQSFLARNDRVPPKEVARFGAAVAEVLAVAHEAGVVHRDIKPGNIMVDRGLASVYLLDFGISKLRDAALSDSSQTREGAILGTPAYMAPEQASGASNATDRSDIYALGVVLYELLAGRPPFEGSNLRVVMVAHILREPPALRETSPEVPEPLAALIHRCLAKAPDARPSAAELAAALRALEPTLGEAPALPTADASTLTENTLL